MDDTTTLLKSHPVCVQSFRECSGRFPVDNKSLEQRWRQQKTTTTKKESKKVPGPNTTVAYFFSPDYYALTDKSMKTVMLVGTTM
jgi:hypothetical protein